MSTNGRGIKRSGSCAICGMVGPLSRTHFPPSNAQFGATAQPVVWELGPDGTRTVALGRERKEALGYLLCARCNGLTSDHDQAYGRLARSLLVGIAESVGQSKVEGPVVIEFEESMPRFSVATSALAGLVAFADGVRGTYPNAVRSLHQLEPQDLHANGLALLLGLAVDTERAAVSGGGGVRRQVGTLSDPIVRGRLSIVGEISEDFALAFAHFRPMSWVLCPAAKATGFPHTDVSDWLASTDPAAPGDRFTLPVLEIDDECFGAPGQFQESKVTLPE